MAAAPLARLGETLGRVFAHVWVLPIGAWDAAEQDNNLLIASDGAWGIPGAVPFAS